MTEVTVPVSMETAPILMEVTLVLVRMVGVVKIVIKVCGSLTVYFIIYSRKLDKFPFRAMNCSPKGLYIRYTNQGQDEMRYTNQVQG